MVNLIKPPRLISAIIIDLPVRNIYLKMFFLLLYGLIFEVRGVFVVALANVDDAISCFLRVVAGVSVYLNLIVLIYCIWRHVWHDELRFLGRMLMAELWLLKGLTLICFVKLSKGIHMLEYLITLVRSSRGIALPIIALELIHT